MDDNPEEWNREKEHGVEKRQKIDALLDQTGKYFHAGRHVSKTGPQQGEFPVDHRDAEFALALAKFFLAYIAKLLPQS